MSETEYTIPDKGWSWVVLLAAFLCNVTFDGIIFSFGIFYLEFLDYFNEGRSYTSWIGSVISGVYTIVGPIASILANKYGCRRVTIIGSLIASAGFVACTFSSSVWMMLITYGLMGGFGFGLMYLCASVMIGHYFEKHRALATGIATCGSGVGTFICAPLSNFLIQSYGWKGGMWIITGIVLNGVVAGCLFRAPNLAPREDQILGKKPKLLDLSLLKNAPFMVFNFSSFLCMIGFFIPFMYLPDFARKHNISKEKGAALVSIIGATNTVGRVLCGWISDKPWADPLKIYSSALVIGGGVTVCLSWLNTFPLIATYAAIFGFCVATYVSLCAIILVEFLGLEKLSNSFGFLNMFRGIATFIGAPIAGALFDKTGSYEVAFYVAGTTIALAGLICIPLRVFRRCGVTRAVGPIFEKECTVINDKKQGDKLCKTKYTVYLEHEKCDELGNKEVIHKMSPTRRLSCPSMFVQRTPLPLLAPPTRRLSCPSIFVVVQRKDSTISTSSTNTPSIMPIYICSCTKDSTTSTSSTNTPSILHT